MNDSVKTALAVLKTKTAAKLREMIKQNKPFNEVAAKIISHKLKNN